MYLWACDFVLCVGWCSFGVWVCVTLFECGCSGRWLDWFGFGLVGLFGDLLLFAGGFW